MAESAQRILPEQLRKQWDEEIRQFRGASAPALIAIFKKEFARRKLPLPCSIDELFEEVHHELPKPWPAGALGAWSASGWRIRKNNFERFLKEYEQLVEGDEARAAAALRHDEPARLRLLAKSQPIRLRFAAVYGQVLSQLVHFQNSPGQQIIPLFNLVYFEMSMNNKRRSELSMTSRFRDLVLRFSHAEPGASVPMGRPRGSSENTTQWRAAAKTEYNDVKRKMPQEPHRVICREVLRRLIQLRLYSPTVKTLERILRPTPRR